MCICYKTFLIGMVSEDHFSVKKLWLKISFKTVFLMSCIVMHIEWHCSILNLLALMTMTLLDNSSVYGYRISIVLSIITRTTSVCPVVPVFPLLIFPLFQYHLYMPMQGTATHSRAQSRSMAIFISCPIIGAEPEHTGMKVNVLSKRSTQKLHYKCSLQPELQEQVIWVQVQVIGFQ